jgi:hypothetical protein
MVAGSSPSRVQWRKDWDRLVGNPGEYHALVSVEGSIAESHQDITQSDRLSSKPGNHDVDEDDRKSVVLFSSGGCRAPFVAPLSAQDCSAAAAEIE